jgi:hypothetical protein
MSIGKAKRKKVPQQAQEGESAAPVSTDVLKVKDKTDGETKKSGKRRHSPEQDEPVKRSRGRPSKSDSESATKSPKLPRTHSGDISPQGGPRQGSSPGSSTKVAMKPSGGTSDDKAILTSPSDDSVNKLIHKQTPPATFSRTGDTPLDDVKLEGLQVDDLPTLDEDQPDDPLFDLPRTDYQLSQSRSVSVNGESTPLPSHRARAANPLVKMVDDPNFGLGMDSAIAAKARLISQPAATANNDETPSNSGPSRAPAFKPGPSRTSQGLQTKNRSSLLVFHKGSLQTRKGKYTPSESNSGSVDVSPDGNDQVDQGNENGSGDDTMEVDDALALDTDKAPTGQELLQMAGLNEADAEALPDFEDDVPDGVASASKEVLTQSRYVLYKSLLGCNLTNALLHKVSRKRPRTCFQQSRHRRSSVPSTLLGSGLQFLTLCRYHFINVGLSTLLTSVKWLRHKCNRGISAQYDSNCCTGSCVPVVLPDP